MFDRSVAENVAYGLRKRGETKSEKDEKVHQALQWAGLSHLVDRNATQLSGGEKQRVALTRARVLSPSLLLLDEPFSNMDLSSRKKTITLIGKLKADGISTIVTSHEPEVARSIGDEHRHLCKTGPSRFTIVQPFLYKNGASERFTMATSSEKNSADGSRHEAGNMPDVNAPDPRVTAVILAGGRAQRMGGEDKGLISLAGKPMVNYIVDAVLPQAGRLIVNANRNLEIYQALGFPVVEDMIGEYYGPLVGMASAMRATETEFLLTVPCDSPLIPKQLAKQLLNDLLAQQAEISVVHDGTRMQPVFALLRRELLDDLLNYLQQGGRKIDTWYAQHKLVLSDFSADADCFVNVNTPEERIEIEKRISQ